MSLAKELPLKLATLSVLALVVMLAASANPTEAQTIPTAWAGIWEFTTDDEVCGGAFIETYVDTSTICPGEEFGVNEDGFDLNCSGTITDTVIDVTCSASLDILTDCTMTITLVTQGTRTGDTFQGTERTSFTYTGTACGPFTDECTDGTVSGVRLNPDPGACGSTPALPTTWGAIKAIYR